jgi:hypothetical protein
MFVERPIPGHVGVGGERDGLVAGLQGPYPYVLDERSSRAHALVIGMDAQLVHVRVAIDFGDRYVAHRRASSANGDPASTIPSLTSELLDGRRFVVRNFCQPDSTESFPSEPLDLLQPTGVELLGGSDAQHAGIITTGLSSGRPVPTIRATVSGRNTPDIRSADS